MHFPKVPMFIMTSDVVEPAMEGSKSSGEPCHFILRTIFAGKTDKYSQPEWFNKVVRTVNSPVGKTHKVSIHLK